MITVYFLGIKLDLSGFNTENVTNMYQMFEDCSSLNNLNVSNFDTKNATNMTYISIRV